MNTRMSNLIHWSFVAVCAIMLFGIFGYMFWDMYSKNQEVNRLKDVAHKLKKDTIELNEKADFCFEQIDRYNKGWIMCSEELRKCRDRENTSIDAINDILEVKK
jgi:uncharacterized coiled-coil DUF342 family protein